jgi:hypothetical protein
MKRVWKDKYPWLEQPMRTCSYCGHEHPMYHYRVHTWYHVNRSVQICKWLRTVCRKCRHKGWADRGNQHYSAYSPRRLRLLAEAQPRT